MSNSPPRPAAQRRDAQRNRERIVASARTVLARDGVEASVEVITRDAGVGMGTLYRHFATKQELIDAVLEDAFDELIQLARQAVADEDPWRGFTSLLEQVMLRHSENRGLKDLLASSEHGRARAREMRGQMMPSLRRLVAAAKAQGVLRHDFAAEDILLLLWGGRGVIDATANAAPECWRRYLALFLDGLRAAPATPLPVGPLTEKQLVGSAGRWGR